MFISAQQTFIPHSIIYVYGFKIEPVCGLVINSTSSWLPSFSLLVNVYPVTYSVESFIICFLDSMLMGISAERMV